MRRGKKMLGYRWVPWYVGRGEEVEGKSSGRRPYLLETTTAMPGEGAGGRFGSRARVHFRLEPESTG